MPHKEDTIEWSQPKNPLETKCEELSHVAPNWDNNGPNAFDGCKTDDLGDVCKNGGGFFKGTFHFNFFIMLINDQRHIMCNLQKLDSHKI